MIFRETFFRPQELERETWNIPAEPYNCTRRLLNHTKGKHMFVPIRTMQYLAILDPEEIVFIDSIGGYMYQDDQGGRIIQLAWRHFHPQARKSISDPVPCHIVYYLPEAKPAMKRLVREFSDALTQMESKITHHSKAHFQTARILALR